MSKFFLGTLKNVKGSAVFPRSADNVLILNPVSNTGESEESSFSEGLEKRWPRIKEEYRTWYRKQHGFKMGATKFTQVQSDIAIASLLVKDGKKLSMEALDTALEEVGKHVELNKLNVHVQVFTTKAKWKKVEELLVKYFVERNINVTIYS